MSWIKRDIRGLFCYRGRTRNPQTHMTRGNPPQALNTMQTLLCRRRAVGNSGAKANGARQILNWIGQDDERCATTMKTFCHHIRKEATAIVRPESSAGVQGDIYGRWPQMRTKTQTIGMQHVPRTTEFRSSTRNCIQLKIDRKAETHCNELKECNKHG